MQVVDRPSMTPAQCAVNLSTEDPGGFIDTGNSPSFVDPRIYVSHQAVVDCARAFGHPIPSPHDQAAVIEQLATLEARVEQLEAELKEADQFMEGIHSLSRAGFTPRKKPGPKPKVEA